MPGTNGSDDIFGGGDPANNGNNNVGQSQSGAGDNPFEALVGEGKKFKTKEDLAKGKLESDAFIAKVTEENAELRKELEAALELARKSASGGQSGGQPEGGKVITNPSNAGDLEKVVETVLTRKNEQATKANNLKEAVDALIGQVGSADAAREAIAKRAEQLGVTAAYLKEQAMISPSAFKELMGVRQGQASSAPATNKPSVVVPKNNSHSGVPNKAYFDNLKKTDPRTYWSPRVQNELFKARKELGEAFYNT